MIVKLKDSNNNVDVIGVYKHHNESTNSFYRRLVEMFPNISEELLQKAVRDEKLLVTITCNRNKPIDELLNNLHI